MCRPYWKFGSATNSMATEGLIRGLILTVGIGKASMKIHIYEFNVRVRIKIISTQQKWGFFFSPSGVLYVKARRGGETTSCGSAHHRKATSVWHTVCLSSCSKSSQSHHCKSGEVKCPSWIVHCWFGNIENRLAIPLCTPIQASLKHRLNQDINPPWLLVKEW